MRAIASLTLALAVAASAQPSETIQGYWKNPIGSAIIAIEPCGHSLCGKVVWASARGRREVSTNTSNIVGTTVLTGVRFDRGHWNGSLYIPDDDIHVSAKLEPTGDGQMKLTGCALFGLLCRSQIWTRVNRLPPRDD
jgi:uncharacterized protein (DUF2147 family)